MALALSPDVERQIEELVQAGRFSSADECVRALLGNDAKERRREEVRRLVAEGTAALEEGDVVEYDDESLKAFLDQIKREGREQRRLPTAS